MRQWKSKVGIAIAGAGMGWLTATESPAFNWVVIFILCFLLYEVIEVYNHMAYHVKALHDRVRRLEKAGECEYEYDNRLESDHD